MLAQTETSWELLLVDDGSTDGSDQIAETAASTSGERIRLLRHPNGENRGLAASRNLVIEHARGEYLCFVDADDRWLPHKLALQLAWARAHPSVAMVCGPSIHQVVSDEGEPRASGEVVPVCAGAPRVVRRGQFARMQVRGKLRTPPPADVMYRTAALRAVGGVPAGSSTHEDQRTFVAVSLHAPVFVADRPLTTYAVRTDSVTGEVRRDVMNVVSAHRQFEQWVVSWSRHQGRQGLLLIAALAERRLRRGLGRRLRLVTDRIRRAVGRAARH